MYQFTFETDHFCFSDVVVVSDLDKNFGGSTDLEKNWHGSADLHTPIHPPLSGKPAFVGDENILCEYHLRAQSTPVKKFHPYLKVEWLKLLQFDFYSRKFEYVGDPS